MNQITLMRKAFALLFFFCLLVTSAISSSVPVSQPVIPTEKKPTNEGHPKSISLLKVKDLEKVVGRKLTLKEKVAFIILKKKLKNEEDKGQQEFHRQFSGHLLSLEFARRAHRIGVNSKAVPPPIKESIRLRAVS